MRKVLFIIWSICLLLPCIQACQNCSSAGSAQSSYVKIGFYTRGQNNALVPDTNAVEAVQPIASNVILTNKTPKTHIIALELPPSRDTVSFEFINEKGRNNIKFGYERKIAVKQPDCGLEDRITKLNIVSHTFDSLKYERDGLNLSDTLVNIVIIQ